MPVSILLHYFTCFVSFNFNIYTNTTVCKVYKGDYCMLDYQKQEKKCHPQKAISALLPVNAPS